MTTQSAKAKGRNLQKLVRNAFSLVGSEYGLEPDDIKSTSMGVSGVDVLFSPAARKLFGKIAIECKNHEKLNVVGVFHEHAAKYKDSLPLLIHKKNKYSPMVTMNFSDYMDMVSLILSYKRIYKDLPDAA